MICRPEDILRLLDTDDVFAIATLNDVIEKHCRSLPIMRSPSEEYYEPALRAIHDMVVAGHSVYLIRDMCDATGIATVARDCLDVMMKHRKLEQYELVCNALYEALQRQGEELETEQE